MRSKVLSGEKTDIKTLRHEIAAATSDPEKQALADFHYLAKLLPSEKKANLTKPCGICTKNKLRKESKYFCEKCKDNHALCVDRCFRVYQQQQGVENDTQGSAYDN